ncbi:MAG: hypothetical protein OWU33_10780 [Firmicutes bacterium]|nr:hypothetical protein [Bacillota bacterium]
MFSAWALAAYAQKGMALTTGHFDTTSRSVAGALLDADAADVHPAYGYSKDHRPDLKQLLMTRGCRFSGRWNPVIGGAGRPVTRRGGLGEYKGPVHVERHFHFLKDPFFVNALCVKKSERLEALGYVWRGACL